MTPILSPLSKGLLDLERRLEGVTSPEALFGGIGETPETQRRLVHEISMSLGRLCEPSSFRRETADLRERAERARMRLDELREGALQRIGSSVYAVPRGSKRPVAWIRSPKGEYRIFARVSSGRIADVFDADVDLEGELHRVLIKVAKYPVYGRYLINESTILGRLSHPSLPRPLDSFEYEGKRASVLSFCDGLSGALVRQDPRWSGGIVPRHHLGWILERQLALLGYLHSEMVIHGAISPESLVIDGLTHNVRLIDFYYARDCRANDSPIEEFTDIYSPEEVALKRPPLPTTDLFGVGKSMMLLAGGDPTSGSIPSDLDKRFADLLRELTNPDLSARTSDAYKAAAHLVTLREAIWGARSSFVPLDTTEQEEHLGGMK